MPIQSRRFIPRLERLGDRSLPSTSAVILPGTTILQITGDDSANAVTISDGGSAITVVGDDGVPQTFDGTAVNSILVNTNGGNDSVVYELSGPLAVTRLVSVSLGRGADTFTANLNGQTVSGDGMNLGISAQGDGGGDTLVLNARGATVVPGATLNVDFHGQAGHDSIAFNYDPGFLDAGNVILTKDQKH